MKRAEKNKEEKESKKRRKRPKVRWIWEKFGKWFFLLLILGQDWVGTSTASEEPQSTKEAMTRMQQGMQIKEHSREEWAPIGRRQPRCEDSTEMQKDAKKVRCTL